MIDRRPDAARWRRRAIRHAIAVVAAIVAHAVDATLSPPMAATPILMVVNEDPEGDAIHSVYVTPVQSESWGPNRLAPLLRNRVPPVLHAGESIEIVLAGGGMAGNCLFSIWIEDTDGDWVRHDGVDLCRRDYVFYP